MISQEIKTARDGQKSGLRAVFVSTVVDFRKGDTWLFRAGLFAHQIELLLQVRHPGADVRELRPQNDFV